MKYCRDCGAGLDDSTQFCIECGQQSFDGGVNFDSKNGLLDTIRDCAKSKLFLGTLAVFLISTVVSFVISMCDLSSVVTSVTAGSSATSSYKGIFTVVLTLIISLVVAVGMIMIHSSAKSNGEMKTTGITLIKVIAVIALVVVCVSLVMMIINTCLFFFHIDSIEPKLGSEWGLLAILANGFYASIYAVALVIATLIFAFFVVYLAFVLRTMTGVKCAIETGVVKGLAATAFTGTTSIVIGAFAALSALGMMVEGTVVVALSTLLSAATLILFGALILNYKKRVTAYR